MLCACQRPLRRFLGLSNNSGLAYLSVSSRALGMPFCRHSLTDAGQMPKNWATLEVPPILSIMSDAVMSLY